MRETTRTTAEGADAITSTAEDLPAVRGDLMNSDTRFECRLGLTRFAPDVERRFHAQYYERVRPTLRIASLLVACLLAGQMLFEARSPAPFDLRVGVPQVLYWLCVCSATYIAGFERFWRPALVLLAWIAASVVLNGLIAVLATQIAASPIPTLPAPTILQQKFYFLLQLTGMMVAFSVLRLPLNWTALLQGGVLAIGLGLLQTHLPAAPDTWRSAHFAVLPALMVLLVLLLAAFSQERLARDVFLSDFLLQKERDSERSQREQTEGQLRVLGQAIGGIVHDLGNPLTAVQVGADVLNMLADSGDANAIRHINGSIVEGAKMLAALRLCLLEETRVLEGKPVPLDLGPEPLRPIVQAGARFQGSSLTSGRTISVVGDDVCLIADRLKMTTVFINLVGNALKYSDGEVRIAWCVSKDFVQIAVMDQGREGKGISEMQARKLFVPFGRLQEHASFGGTGLGLVSVMKTVEAHGGEIFIEGHWDGAAASPDFSTSRQAHASSLAPGFLTAFVVTCPRETEDEDDEALAPGDVGGRASTPA